MKLDKDTDNSPELKILHNFENSQRKMHITDFTIFPFVIQQRDVSFNSTNGNRIFRNYSRNRSFSEAPLTVFLKEASEPGEFIHSHHTSNKNNLGTSREITRHQPKSNKRSFKISYYREIFTVLLLSGSEYPPFKLLIALKSHIYNESICYQELTGFKNSKIF